MQLDGHPAISNAAARMVDSRLRLVLPVPCGNGNEEDGLAFEQSPHPPPLPFLPAHLPGRTLQHTAIAILMPGPTNSGHLTTELVRVCVSLSLSLSLSLYVRACVRACVCVCAVEPLLRFWLERVAAPDQDAGVRKEANLDLTTRPLPRCLRDEDGSEYDVLERGEFVNTLAAELFRRADEVEELQRSLVEAAACLELQGHLTLPAEASAAKSKLKAHFNALIDVLHFRSAGLTQKVEEICDSKQSILAAQRESLMSAEKRMGN